MVTSDPGSAKKVPRKILSKKGFRRRGQMRIETRRRKAEAM